MMNKYGRPEFPGNPHELRIGPKVQCWLRNMPVTHNNP
jgi:hypothetical protein